MSLLVVGSVALDSIFTPFGETADTLGGSAVFFSVAGALLHPVQVVGVVGDDYPMDELERLAPRGIDWSGVERAAGESFRWKGKYSYDLQSRETLETRLGVFADFAPKLPDAMRDAEFVFLGNIDPELQLNVLEQVRQPRLVANQEMMGQHGQRQVVMPPAPEAHLVVVAAAVAVFGAVVHRRRRVAGEQMNRPAVDRHRHVPVAFRRERELFERLGREPVGGLRRRGIVRAPSAA